MNRPQYRLVEYSTLDIWILQKRFLWIFWISITAGKHHELVARVKVMGGTYTEKFLGQ